MIRKILLFGTLVIMIVGAACVAAQQTTSKTANPVSAQASGLPLTLLHIITVKWKADATEAQKQTAIDGAKKMIGVVPGLKNIWVKKIKLQTKTDDGKDYDAIIAMEFTDQAALDAYAKHPAHDEWYKVYMPIREESRTHDVSN